MLRSIDRVVWLSLLAAPLCLTACKKASPADSGSSAEPAAGPAMPSVAADEAAAPPLAARTTSTKREWSVGGLVGGKSETVTTEPVFSPPVIEEPPSPPRERAEVQSGTLTAGDVDDLLNPAHYATYAGRFLQSHGQGLPFVDTRTRVVIRVVDRHGRPVAAARADVARPGGALRLVTAADGTASYYPRFDKVPAQTSITIMSSAGKVRRAISPGNGRIVPIALPGDRHAVSALDLTLVIDTTGSMGDEMDYLRAELDTIVSRLKRDAGNLDLRIGVILYRDEGDDYVVRTKPLTSDVAAIRATLDEQEANGGGDTPEAMEQALVAATRMQWRPDAAKAVLLVTDAPPHDENVGKALSAAQVLRSQGVQIVPVGASGVEDVAQYVLRTMAAMTQGRYIFLTDDSGVGDSHAEPDVACYVVTHLDQLVARVLAGIVTGQRIEPRRSDVIRTVGDYQRGRCRVPGQAVN